MKCAGCGVTLQTVEPDLEGYIPESVLISRTESKEPMYCQRCFKLKHYGVLPSKLTGKIDFGDIKQYLELTDNVILVIDVFDFNGTAAKEVIEKLKSKRTHYVVNKIDLIPQEISRDELIKWSIESLNVDSTKIYLVSSTKRFGINRLLKRLSDEKEKTFLLVGMTNVGKSSLINALESEDRITVSKYPGTTMKTLKIYDEKHDITFIDTPGLSANNRMTDSLPLECQKKITPRKKLKVYTVNAKRNRSIFIGGFVKITIKGDSGTDSPILNIITSENTTIHETDPEKATKKWKEWFGTLLVPPCKKSNLDQYSWEKINDEFFTGEELNISGLGWFSVARGPARIHIEFLSDLKLTKRKGLVGPTTFK
ncbi:MAG: GTPase [Thermotogota bacterium]|nr:GTPase [Thermotogota bacterium]